MFSPSHIWVSDVLNINIKYSKLFPYNLRMNYKNNLLYLGVLYNFTDSLNLQRFIYQLIPFTKKYNNSLNVLRHIPFLKKFGIYHNYMFKLTDLKTIFINELNYSKNLYNFFTIFLYSPLIFNNIFFNYTPNIFIDFYVKYFLLGKEHFLLNFFFNNVDRKTNTLKFTPTRYPLQPLPKLPISLYIISYNKNKEI